VIDEFNTHQRELLHKKWPKDYCSGGATKHKSFNKKARTPGYQIQTTACPITGCILHMEIQGGKKENKDSSITERLAQQLVVLFAFWKHHMMIAYHMG
jgi:hypothetical protein